MHIVIINYKYVEDIKGKNIQKVDTLFKIGTISTVQLLLK